MKINCCNFNQEISNMLCVTVSDFKNEPTVIHVRPFNESDSGWGIPCLGAVGFISSSNGV